MQCPHCGAEHREEEGRFCTRCGLLIIRHATPPDEDEDKDADSPSVRCPTCGAPGSPPRCRQCGARISETSEPEK